MEDSFDRFCTDWTGDECLPSMSSADYYFQSYSHYHVYEEILKDVATMTAYRNAILRNKHLFKDKVVLDIGCGLGIMSLLAAKAGAKHVFGVDQPELISCARSIAQDNGYGNVITYLKGSVDTVTLPVDSVDIIVSLCMGYFLLSEAKFADILTAKKRWLTPHGLMFPDRFRLYIDLLKDNEYCRKHFDFCNNLWDFNFSSMKHSSVGEAVIHSWSATEEGNKHIISNDPWLVHDIDLNQCTIEDVRHVKATKWRLRARIKGNAHGLIAWFEAIFTKCHIPVALTTSPRAPYTCWQHTALFFKNPVKLKEGEVLEGVVAARNVPGRRLVEIKVAYCRGDAHDWITQFFELQ